MPFDNGELPEKPTENFSSRLRSDIRHLCILSGFHHPRLAYFSKRATVSVNAFSYRKYNNTKNQILQVFFVTSHYFYKEKQKRGNPPPLTRFPSLFCFQQNRDDKNCASFTPCEALASGIWYLASFYNLFFNFLLAYHNFYIIMFLIV